MKSTIGIHIGNSYIEMSHSETHRSKKTQTTHHQRIYFPKLGLKTSLKSLFQDTEITPETSLVISLEYLEKILSTRLGGSVAQVVTKGFENYLLLKEATCKTSTHLGNPDLIFGIKERTLADGTIHTPLHLEELEFIESKFAMMEVKRVAIHLMHAKTNPSHQNKIAEYFASKGYEVYLPQHGTGTDERSRWHRNLLNASFKGSFEELKKEILEALQDKLQPQQLFFLNARGQTFQDTPWQLSSSLFGSYSNLAMNSETLIGSDVLYLGIEKFFFIPQKVALNSKWLSPWGTIELEHPNIVTLPFNIGSQLKIDEFQEITIEKKIGSFDPGPISFGRGIHLSVIDLWFDELQQTPVEGLSEHLRPQLSSKISNTLMVLAKMSGKSSFAPSELVESLKSQVIEEIWIQIAPFLQQESFTITGPLSPLLSSNFHRFSKRIKFFESDYWLSTHHLNKVVTSHES